jgi:hypothetical protein
VDSWMRYIGGAVGFGFGAMWMTTGIGAAIACVLLAAFGFGVVLVAERAQANANAQRLPADAYDLDTDLPLTADDFELEERYDEKIVLDEPPAEELPAEKPQPVAARADYGWPVG